MEQTAIHPYRIKTDSFAAQINDWEVSKRVVNDFVYDLWRVGASKHLLMLVPMMDVWVVFMRVRHRLMTM
jgi:hypothetical protein